MTSGTIIMLSPYFPPSMLAGVHRARLLAKHLPTAGWNPIVLCVDEAFHGQRLDWRLAALVPPSVEVVKVPAQSTKLMRRLGVGDISLRAWSHLRRALFRLLATRKINGVLITGAPFYHMLFAPQIKRSFGVPVVLDFQDPWVSDWGTKQPALSKAGLAHRLAMNLEPRALRGASYITSVSEVQNQEMRERYPWLNPSLMSALPIGGDPDDFRYLTEYGVGSPIDLLDKEAINFSFVGTFMPRSGPLMRQLLRALCRLKREDPRLAARICFSFVGTSNEPDEFARYSVRPIAQEEGVADAIREIPQRLPYLDAISVLARSHAVLLIGSEEPHYTASKIYPGLMSGRPFLSIFHQSSSSHAILSSAGGGIALSFRSAEELSDLEISITQALRILALNPETVGRSNPMAYAPYEASAIAARYACILESICSD